MGKYFNIIGKKVNHEYSIEKNKKNNKELKELNNYTAGRIIN